MCQTKHKNVFRDAKKQRNELHLLTNVFINMPHTHIFTHSSSQDYRQANKAVKEQIEHDIIKRFQSVTER